MEGSALRTGGRIDVDEVGGQQSSLDDEAEDQHSPATKGSPSLPLGVSPCTP